MVADSLSALLREILHVRLLIQRMSGEARKQYLDRLQSLIWELDAEAPNLGRALRGKGFPSRLEFELGAMRGRLMDDMIRRPDDATLHNLMRLFRGPLNDREHELILGNIAHDAGIVRFRGRVLQSATGDHVGRLLFSWETEPRSGRPIALVDVLEAGEWSLTSIVNVFRNYWEESAVLGVAARVHVLRNPGIGPRISLPASRMGRSLIDTGADFFHPLTRENDEILRGTASRIGVSEQDINQFMGIFPSAGRWPVPSALEEWLRDAPEEFRNGAEALWLAPLWLDISDL